MTGELKSKQENRKNSFTTSLPARGHLNTLPFLFRTTMDPEQFHQVTIRALVFRRTCALGASLTGYDASKPSGYPIVKLNKSKQTTIPYLLFSTSSISPRRVTSGSHACRRFPCFGFPPVLTNGETASTPVACHVAARALVPYGQYQITGLLRRYVVWPSYVMIYQAWSKDDWISVVLLLRYAIWTNTAKAI